MASVLSGSRALDAASGTAGVALHFVLLLFLFVGLMLVPHVENDAELVHQIGILVIDSTGTRQVVPLHVVQESEQDDRAVQAFGLAELLALEPLLNLTWET